MMTKDEAYRLNEIKQLIKDGRKDCVTDLDRQWVLDILKRENVAIDPRVKSNAAAMGFQTKGIKTK